MATKTSTGYPEPTIVTADGRDEITCHCGQDYCGITFSTPEGYVTSSARSASDLKTMVHNYANMILNVVFKQHLEAKGFRWED